MRRTVLLVPLLLGCAAAHAVEVPLDTPATVSFGAGGRVALDLEFSIPEGIEGFEVVVSGPSNGADVDLFLRGGRPFPMSGGNSTVFVDDVFESAQYRSISSGVAESILVTSESTIPVNSGPWHLILTKSGVPEVDVTLEVRTFAVPPVVPIEVVFDAPEGDCSISEWNDTAPRDPVGGNEGTTLGEQRRNALLEAARKLTEALRPRAPIRVRACWVRPDEPESVLASAFSEVLLTHDYGFSYAREYFYERRGITPPPPFSSPFATLPERYVSYSAAATSHNQGTNICGHLGGSCGEDWFDIRVQFNPAIDERDTRNYFYGFDRSGLGSSPDFISLSIHEITHGLGFFGRVSVGSSDFALGERTSAYDDAYTRHVRWTEVDLPEGALLFDLDDADRAQALTSQTHLRFAGPNALTSSRNFGRNNPVPDNYIQLYAPEEPNPGSTLSHVNLSGQLMYFASGLPYPHSLGLAEPILHDVGWAPGPKAVPTFPLPRGTQLIDVTRIGHGVAMYRVAGFEDLYFVVFYSYDADGRPEYFVATGSMVDGVFLPLRDPASQDSLVRSLYIEGEPTPLRVDTSPSFDGQIRIDFNQASQSPACNDGQRDPSQAWGVMTWTLNGEQGQWCLQPLAPAPTGLNFTNVWFDPSDGGWGVSTLGFDAGAAQGLGFQIYYPDADGNPRWATAQTGEFNGETSLELFEVRGYCRTCPYDGGELERIPVGTVGLELADPAIGAGAGSNLDLEVQYAGPEGGQFQRQRPISAAGVPGG